MTHSRIACFSALSQGYCSSCHVSWDPPKHEEKVVGGEIRDVLPFEEPHVIRDDSILCEIVEEPAGMVVVHVLEDKGALHDNPISRAA